jgi:hypothetical protein
MRYSTQECADLGLNLGLNMTNERNETPEPLAADAEVAAQEKCAMCNGHGLIGGFVSDGDGGGGYDSEPCPDCASREQKAELIAALASAHAKLIYAGADSARLDWLDAANARFRMGWDVGCAPAGNVSVKTIIMGGKKIREAIDATMPANEAPAGDGETAQVATPLEGLIAMRNEKLEGIGYYDIDAVIAAALVSR